MNEIKITEAQKKAYDSYTAEGMAPDEALMLATRGSDNQFNPAMQAGVDNVLFGDKSLFSSITSGVKEALTGGFKKVYDDTGKYGAMYALKKSPLSLAAAAGRGVGIIGAGVAETVDDLTGEYVSGALAPVVEGAANSDVGQYLMQRFSDFNEANRGVPGEIVDTLNLMGLSGIAKGGTAQAIKAAFLGSGDDVARQGARMSLRDLLSGGKSAATGAVDDVANAGVRSNLTLGDRVMQGAIKGFEEVKKIPDAIGAKARASIDRQIIDTATNNPLKAEEAVLDLYKRGIVPGVKKKNKTVATFDEINSAVKRVVPELAKKYDVADIEDFANAINAEKKTIFSSIDKGLKATDQKINLQTIVDRLDELANDERAQFNSSLRKAIDRTRREFVDEVDGVTIGSRSISASGAQDLIADLNARLQSYFRGSTSATNADVIVDQLVVNNLRKMVDDVVENLGDGSFKELKSRYADLKKLEDDVVHRAIFEAQKGGGLADLTDIMAAGDIAAGSLSPTFLLKGVGQFMTKEVMKSLSDKNELIRQMFLYGKHINASVDNVVKKTSKATKATKVK